MPERMYSQRDEERVIVDWFAQHGKVTGRFLDVGAYNAKVFSNTRRLYELGWSGVMVEGGPAQAAALADEYGTEPRITLVNCVLAEACGWREFGVTRDALSSLDKAHQQLWHDNQKVQFSPVQVYAMDWKTFIARFGPRFDFISIDVEGFNWSLIRTINFGTLGASLLCLEYGANRAEIVEHVRPWGYTLLHDTGENILLGWGK